MQALINSTSNNHHPIIHMCFHSSSLISSTARFMLGVNTHNVIDHTQKKQILDFARYLKRLLFLNKEKITPNTNHAN